MREEKQNKLSSVWICEWYTNHVVLYVIQFFEILFSSSLHSLDFFRLSWRQTRHNETTTSSWKQNDKEGNTFSRGYVYVWWLSTRRTFFVLQPSKFQLVFVGLGICEEMTDWMGDGYSMMDADRRIESFASCLLVGILLLLLRQFVTTQFLFFLCHLDLRINITF